MPEYIIVSTLGFDERPVIRSLGNLGFRNVKKIFLLRPIKSDPRSDKAVSEIRRVTVLAGISDKDIIVKEIDVYDFWSSVAEINTFLRRQASSGNKVIFNISGGLRILVIEAFYALLLLPDESKKNIRVQVEPETGSGSILIDASELITSLEIPQTILDALRIISETPGINLSTLSRLMVKPASTTWRILDRLVKEGLVEKKGRGYYVTSKGAALYKLHSRLEELLIQQS